MDIRRNYSLLEHNTFGMDVYADCYVEYGSPHELLQVIEMAAKGDLPYPLEHIGGGSNILFTGNFHGTILKSGIRDMDYIENMEFFSEDCGVCRMRIGAGVVWDDLCRYCAENDMWGIENLALIPGQVGGAIVQNIGAYGAEIAGTVESVEAVSLATGETKIFDRASCGFGYRDSAFKHELAGWAVTYVVFRFHEKSEPDINYGELRKVLSGMKGCIADEMDLDSLTPMDVRNAVVKIRRSKLPDPAVLGSAGSFFKNPLADASLVDRIRLEYPDVPAFAGKDGAYKLSAAWLIDKCGWKGYNRPASAVSENESIPESVKDVENAKSEKQAGQVELSGAGCYEKQPLVIVNNGNAEPSDIMQLADAVRDSVKRKFGIELVPEVKYI